MMDIGAPSKATAGEKKVDQNHFPTRLHMMLSSLENSADGLGGVVCWQPHGRAFIIRNTDLFIQQILPKWFCRLKFTSFQRQLCLYGFRKLSKKGPDQGGYYHLSFIRDRLDLATRIEPGKIKNKRGRRPKSDENEPNFYQLPPAPEELHPAQVAGDQAANAPHSSKPSANASAATSRAGSAPAPAAAINTAASATAATKEQKLEAAQLEYFLLTPKDDSTEQLSLENIMQQPQCQEEIFDDRKQPSQHPSQLAGSGDVQWPNIDIQQSLAAESRSLAFTQTASQSDASAAQLTQLYSQDLLLQHSSTAAPASITASLPRSAASSRRMSDFSLAEATTPAWGWDSLTGGLDAEAAEAADVAAVEPFQPTAAQEPTEAQGPTAAQGGLGMSNTLTGSGFQQEPQQPPLLVQNEHQRLQQILQQQRRSFLMDLNQKQQTNLKIQHEQLEQQRLELQMRDQEQLRQLRLELQAREENQQQSFLQQQRRQSASRLLEPLPRPPALFKPQLQHGGQGPGIAQVAAPTLQQQRQQQQQQHQQQHQRQQQHQQQHQQQQQHHHQQQQQQQHRPTQGAAQQPEDSSHQLHHLGSGRGHPPFR